MGRYEQTYAGERRTAGLRVQLTPGERAELERAAHEAGEASLSSFVRMLCLRRPHGTGRVAGTRRNPDARALAGELSAIGNNLNQLTRIANTTGDTPALADLRAIIAALKAAFARVIAL